MSDPAKFVVPNAVEQQSGIYRATLRDENGAAVAAQVLTTFTLTLYNLSSGTVINSRSAQNVLNANQVTVDGSGNVVWNWLPADMTIINPNLNSEEHVALFEAKWLDSQLRNRQGNHEVHFIVNRVAQLT